MTTTVTNEEIHHFSVHPGCHNLPKYYSFLSDKSSVYQLSFQSKANSVLIIIDMSSYLKNKAPWTRYPGRSTNQLSILLPVTYFSSCLCLARISVNFMLSTKFEKIQKADYNFYDTKLLVIAVLLKMLAYLSLTYEKFST